MKDKAVLFVAVGLPGSGKSTFGEKLEDTRNGELKVVSTDRIRERLYGDENIQGDGNLVFSTAYSEAENNLKQGIDVFFDATNTTKYARKNLLNRLVKHAGNCVALYFDTPLDVCKERNKKRSRVVPEEVIVRMYKKLTKPKKEEGFSSVVVVHNN